MAGKKTQKTVLIAVLAAVAVTAIVLLAMGVSRKNTRVSREEFLLIYENEIRPRVLILSQDPGGDWQQEPYGNTTLGQYALRQTVDAVRTYKAQQQLFRQYGVCDFSFEEFVAQWKSQENDGNPYGVQAYSQYDYYVYLHSIYRLQVIEQLTVEDAAVKAYYEENAAQFLNADTWVLEVWQVTGQTPDAQTVLENAMNGKTGEPVSYAEITVDEDGAKYYSELLVLLSDAMEHLKTPGQTVYRENDQVCLLARSKSFAAGQPKPYEECKDVVRNRCKQELFAEAAEQAFENITVAEQALPEAGK